MAAQVRAQEDGTSSFAGGGDAALERALGGGWRGRVDALADGGGYGGDRVGGTAELSWRADKGLWLRGRAIVLDVKDDDLTYHANVTVVTSSSVVSTTWQVADQVAIHGIAEVDYDDIHALQTRLIAVLDLSFIPEP